METTGVPSDVDDVLTVHGVKNWVTNGGQADIIVTFAKLQTMEYAQDRTMPSTALIIDRGKTEGISVVNKCEPLGIKGANICDLRFDHVRVPGWNVLWSEGEGFNVAAKTIEGGQFVWGAVATAFIKRILGDTAKYCSSVKRYDKKLSEMNAIRKRIYDLTLKAYAVESMAYYVAGLLDEDPSKDMSVEGAMTKLYAREVMRETVSFSMQACGPNTLTVNGDSERQLRDLVTLGNFFHSDDFLHSYIAMNGIMSWAAEWKDTASKLSDRKQYPWATAKKTSSRLIGAVTGDIKFKHYINEHVHPSLEVACRHAEDSMAKFNSIFSDLVTVYGTDIEEEYFVLERISGVGQLLFAMLTVISRASRAYCIGLRNADKEVAYAQAFCIDARYKILHSLHDLQDETQYMYLDNMKKAVAIDFFNTKGWLIDHPLSKNW